MHDSKAEHEVDEQTGEDFVPWCKAFDLAAQTDTITHLLEEDESLRAMHAKLVPEHVSYATFWQNYFWQLHLQEALTRKRLSILRRMQKPSGEAGAAEGAAKDGSAHSEAGADQSQQQEEEHKGGEEEAASTARHSRLEDDDDEEEMGWGSDEDEEDAAEAGGGAEKKTEEQ